MEHLVISYVPAFISGHRPGQKYAFCISHVKGVVLCVVFDVFLTFAAEKHCKPHAKEVLIESKNHHFDSGWGFR